MAELGPWHHFWELLVKVRTQLLFGVENDGLFMEATLSASPFRPQPEG